MKSSTNTLLCMYIWEKLALLKSFAMLSAAFPHIDGKCNSKFEDFIRLAPNTLSSSGIIK